MWSEPSPQGAWLALGLVCQGDGIHYPVAQPLLGDSLSFLLTSVTSKELGRVRSVVLADRILCSIESSSAKGPL